MTPKDARGDKTTGLSGKVWGFSAVALTPKDAVATRARCLTLPWQELHQLGQDQGFGGETLGLPWHVLNAHPTKSELVIARKKSNEGQKLA